MREAKTMRDVVHKADAETAIDQVRTLQQALENRWHLRARLRG